MRYISASRVREQLFIAPKFKSASDKRRQGRMMAYDGAVGSEPEFSEEVAPKGNRDALNQIVQWAQENLSQEEIRNLTRTLGNGAAPAEDQEEKTDKTEEVLQLVKGKLDLDEIDAVKQLLAGARGATEHPALKGNQPSWQDKMSNEDAATIEECSIVSRSPALSKTWAASAPTASGCLPKPEAGLRSTVLFAMAAIARKDRSGGWWLMTRAPAPRS